MGLDMYIESITDRNKELFDPLFHEAVVIRDYVNPADWQLKQFEGFDGHVESESYNKSIKSLWKFFKDGFYDNEFPEWKKELQRLKRSKLFGKARKAKELGAIAQKYVHFFYEKMYEQGYFRDSYNATNLLSLLHLNSQTDYSMIEDDDQIVKEAEMIVEASHVCESAKNTGAMIEKIMSENEGKPFDPSMANQIGAGMAMAFIKMKMGFNEILGELTERTDDGAYMSPQNAKTFKYMVETATLILHDKDTLKQMGCCIDDKENTAEAWHKSFQENRQELIDFLTTAIHLDEPIRVSA